MLEPRDTLRVLMELTRRLSFELPLTAALREVTDAALELADGQHASIRLFDETGTSLLSSARSGAGAEHAPVDFRPGEGLVGWVAEHGERLRIDDAPGDTRFEVKPSQGFSVRSYLGIPLYSSNEIIGVLAITSPAAAAFSDDDELLGQLLGNCIIPAVDRARLRQLAITDDQTRAFNIRYLMPRLRREIERSRKRSTPLSLLSLDIDRFKSVNDVHGHAVGDHVLASFVDRVRENVRGRDVLVRRGGDEFVLLMPGTPIGVAERVAERIREAVEAVPLAAGDERAVDVTVTVGVVEWNGHEVAEELEERADRAMYAGKTGGRNRVMAEADGA